MTHAISGSSLAVQAEGQRVEFVVTGQRGRGRGSGGWGGLLEVWRCVSKRLGGVLPNCRRETRNQTLNVSFPVKIHQIIWAVFTNVEVSIFKLKIPV